MRGTFTFMLAFAAGVLLGPAAARAADFDLSGHRLTRSVATPHAPVTAPITTSGVTSPWTPLGPANWAGRFHCVSSDILNLPVVGCGSDGVGYWWGYGLVDAGWEERGREGGGILQMTNRLHFPEGGGYYQPINTIRTDGSMWVTPDDGVNWLETYVSLPPGYSIGRTRLLGYDSGSINVAYALAYGSDVFGRNGALILRSFDGGQTFDFTRFVATERASMWFSRQGAGRILLAYSDDWGDVVLERNDLLADPNGWNGVSTWTPTYGAAQYDSIYVVAQEHANPDSMLVWVAANGALHRSDDGGATFTFVRDVNANGDRPYATSLLTPDLLMWTEPNQVVHWSDDGGLSAHTIPTSVFGDVGTVHPTTGEVDCFKWNFGPPADFTVRHPAAPGTQLYASEKRTLPAGAVKVRRAEGAAPQDANDFERFYLSTGGGVFVWSSFDTTSTRLTGFGVNTLQVNDVLPLRDPQLLYSTLLATRDVGLMAIREWGPTVPGDVNWSGLITSYPLDIGHVVSSMKPTPTDPVFFGDFRFGGITTSGDGVFTGTGVGLAGYYHPALVADPVGPYRFWIADTYLHRVTWNRTANTWSDDAIPSPSDTYGTRGIGFAIAPSNTSRMYYETEDGRVFYSANAGATWLEGAVGPGIGGSGPLPNDPAEYHYVTITVNPTNALEAWIVGTSVIRTTDGGANWSTMQSGLPPQARAWDIAYDGTPAANVYIAADSGPFRWNTGVGAWEDLAPAGGVVPNVPFRSVAAVPWQGAMRWGTWGRGVWEYHTFNTTGAPAPAGPSIALAASRNPVRDLARLDWTLSQPGHVRLELLDVAGRRVQTLHDGLETAGEHSSTLDVRGLGAGVYFARLTAGAEIRSARVVVVR